jgi:hypothetical protein
MLILSKPSSKLTGKDIKAKADVALRERKKYLAFRNEFLKDGKFPSGKIEEDALNFVLTRIKETLNIDQEEDEEEEDDDEISSTDILSSLHGVFYFIWPIR